MCVYVHVMCEGAVEGTLGQAEAGVLPESQLHLWPV